MKKGFTLVELTISIGIFVLLAMLSVTSFSPTYSGTNLEVTKNVLIADIKTAQSNAMSGKNNVNWYIEKTSPTSYAIMPDNFATTLPTGVSIATTFSNDKLEFARLTGEIVGYTQDHNTLTLTSGTRIKTIQFNQYGVVTGD